MLFFHKQGRSKSNKKDLSETQIKWICIICLFALLIKNKVELNEIKTR